MLHIVYSDLFILMGEALLEIAVECQSPVDDPVRRQTSHTDF